MSGNVEQIEETLDKMRPGDILIYPNGTAVYRTDTGFEVGIPVGEEEEK